MELLINDRGWLKDRRRCKREDEHHQNLQLLARKVMANARFEHSKENIDKLLQLNKRLIELQDECAKVTFNMYKDMMALMAQGKTYYKTFCIETSIIYESEENWESEVSGLYDSYAKANSFEIGLSDAPGREPADYKELNAWHEDLSWNIETLDLPEFKDWELMNFVEKLFDSVIEKYMNAHSKEVTVIIPEGNMCYDFIAERILAKADEGLSSNGRLIEGRIHALCPTQVYDAIDDGDSKIRALYGRDFNEVFHKLGPTVGEEIDGLFDRNTILDKDVRDAVDLTLKHCKEFWAEDANKINGRHVLILGHPMGGASDTINDLIKTLKQCYAPKSVTVLQMVARDRG